VTAGRIPVRPLDRAHYPEPVARTSTRPPAPKNAATKKRGISLRRRAAKTEPAGPSPLERVKQAYQVGRKHEPLILLWPILGFLLPVALGVGLGLAFNHLIIGPLLGVIVGLLAGMNLFFLRAQRGLYAEHAGTPGVALQVIRSLRGDWKITEAVQFNRSQELVHRVIGRPGVILVAEGRSANVRNLLAAEAKRTRRIAPDVAVHEIVVGDRDGDVPLIKLRSHMNKLPRVLRGPAVKSLDVKLKAVANTSVPLPKGPMPTRMPRGKMR
jgi:hypothetical protein